MYDISKYERYRHVHDHKEEIKQIHFLPDFGFTFDFLCGDISHNQSPFLHQSGLL